MRALITIVVLGIDHHTQIIIDANSVPKFIRLLSSPVLRVREQAVFALGNIARRSPIFRDYILQKGALMPLLTLLSENHELSTQRKATWTLAELCRDGDPKADWKLVRLRALPSSLLWET